MTPTTKKPRTDRFDPAIEPRWREFWQYYELHYQISLRFVTPVYALLCLLGVISTVVVLHRYDI